MPCPAASLVCSHKKRGTLLSLFVSEVLEYPATKYESKAHVVGRERRLYSFVAVEIVQISETRVKANAFYVVVPAAVTLLRGRIRW